MGYPLSLVLAVLFAAYSLVTMMAIVLWRKNPTIDINRATDKINFALCGVLTVCAWFFQQSTYVDLDRMMEEIGQGPDLLLKLYGSQPLSFVLLMIGYWTGDRRVLQVIGCALTYGLAMVIIAELKKMLHPDPITAFLGTMLYLVRPGFVTAVTNIRFWIAVELLLLAGVIWLKRKRWQLPVCLIVAGILLHSGVIPVIMGFAIAMISSRSLFVFLCVIAVLYSAFLSQIIDFLSSFGVTFFDYVSTRMAAYYGEGMSQGSYDAEMLEAGGNLLGIRMLCIIIPMVLLYFIFRSSLSQVLPAGMERFIIFELVFVAGSSQSYTVFIRYTILALYLMIPVMFCYLSHFFINDCHVSGMQKNNNEKAVRSFASVMAKPLFLFLLLALFFFLLCQWHNAYYSSVLVF